MWVKGHIDPIWDKSYKKFPYVRQPLSDELINTWRLQGHTNEHFNGLMYDSTNPMPAWTDEISQKLNLINCGFVFYKMPAGIIMPSHIDHFSRYSKVFNVDKNKVYRAIIFLEDWRSGHYFEINNTPIVDHKAGDYVFWSWEETHSVANIGIEDRYTLQITGCLNE